MAKIQRMIADNTSIDRAANLSGCLKVGDVVRVEDDSYVFSDRESLPPFETITVPGSRADNLYLLEPERVNMRDRFPLGMLKMKRLHHVLAKSVRNENSRLRKYSVDADGIPVMKLHGVH